MINSRFSKFAGFVVLAIGLSLAAFAADTGSITISGSVPAIIEISVQAESVSSALPVTTTVSDLRVATVTERSNKKAGYTVRLDSANARADGSANPSFKSVETSDVLPYSIRYDGNVVSFSGGSAIVSNASGRTGMDGVTKDVSVSFDGASRFLDESTYSDTLTFTISAK